MTISEAIASEIQPFSTSDEALEKMFIDASNKYDITASVSDDYTVAMKKPVAYSAMRLLMKMRPLSSENIGGISQGYKDKNSLIDDRIRLHQLFLINLSSHRHQHLAAVINLV